ncbi:MAG: T9SS type A sorting domain-containing protein [Prolixibacteraceae bacterium]|nr:T9SS type A sorting domain-containing protein [Prolixibacteraceae bacterium]
MIIRHLNHTCTLFLLILSVNIHAQWDKPNVYYQFNEASGSLIIDSSGNGFDAAADCADCWEAEGKFDGAFHFSSHEKIDLPADDISLTSAEGTVAFWLRLPETSVSDINCIWWAGEFGGDMFGPQNEMHINSEFFENNIWTGGEIAFVINDSLAKKNFFIYSDPWKGDNPATPPSGNEITLTDNMWHHVACTWDSGGTIALYIDGQAIWDSMAYQPSRTWACNLMTLGVANKRNNRRLNGYLDEFRLYNHALKAAEIVEIFNFDQETNLNYIRSINIAGISILNCYPNPASRYVSFRNPARMETIEIYGITGEKLLVKHFPCSTEVIELNIEKLSSGLYIVRAYKNEMLVAAGKFSKK